ncbi:NAD(P)H-hydrate dehydratase [Coralliovum pocilloporae]|uniref:NAD(P)H-hydrate dehydratase n=1 Tax=Coralliovum pocilloporae TaxID=3066369 RepID=UPI003307334A
MRSSFLSTETILLTPGEMNRADALTIDAGTPGIDLMERAGQAIADTVESLGPQTGGSVLVCCGGGNNGGDGYVVARLLKETGWSVTLCTSVEPAKLKGDAALAAKAWTGDVLTPDQIAPEAYGVVIDALLGAGLDRDVTGPLADLIGAINNARQNHGAKVIAVDLPSGIDGGTGLCRGIAVEADITVTFYRKKPGHCLFPGRGHCGKIDVADIGISDDVLSAVAPSIAENRPGVFPNPANLTTHDTHKYKRGHVMVTSGPMIRTGAARLAAEAALRSGAGLVTVASPLDALMVHAAHLTAVMIRQVDEADELRRTLADGKCTALVVGPANGVGEETRARVAVGLMSGLPVILDADALTSFEREPDCLFEACETALTLSDISEASVVMTPHEGEFRRLFPDLALRLGSKGRVDCVREAAERASAVIVLKGPDTVIAAPDGRTAINTNAPRWLATAGSGDVLAGIIAGVAAQGLSVFEAACAGVWLHGEAGNEASCGLTAEDLARAVSTIMRRLSDDG